MAHGRPGSATSTSTTSIGTVAAIEQAGGKTLMPPIDIPNVGRIAMVTDPQGAPFYVMKPIPPAGDPNAQERRLLAESRAARRLERASTTRPGRRAPLLRRAVRLDERRVHGHGRDGRIPLLRAERAAHRRAVRCHGRQPVRTGASISGCRRSTRAKASAEAEWRNGPHGTAPRCPAATHRDRHRPAGRGFALVGGQ